MDLRQSKELYERACAMLPGGVNSPVRAFRGVGGTPIFFREGSGPFLTDVDGNRFIDLVGSWGPLILGHAHPAVVEAIERAARSGASYGAPHAGELELAELMRAAVPSLERVRMVSSGSEATTAAIRLARAATGRDLILKFDGCYHGAVDSLLVKAGSGVETLGLPDSPGVPGALAALTLTAPFNDLDYARDLFARKGDALAALIIEPVVGNMGVLPPKPGFLQGLRELCDRCGALFICDEVMTGFRVARGGAQERFGLRPDLSTFGKIIGGGLPVGAFGGRADLMSLIAPAGPVYQAGTLSGNPLATAAGIATLRELSHPGFYEHLESATARLTEAIARHAERLGIALCINRVGSMFTLFFCASAPHDAASARQADAKRFGRFFHELLAEGVYLPPSQFEAAFLSAAHRDETIDAIASAAARALERI